VLIKDRETLLRPGEVACWPAGAAVGHCLVNRSTMDTCYLVIDTRKSREVIHYPDHDLVVHKNCEARAWFHADGRAREV
jgi:uncharacterized cupin superfamily protein